MTTYYAHTLEGRPPEEWQTLTDHLEAVARRAGAFADLFGAGPWARVAGQLHDVGKCSAEFQRYLCDTQSPDCHTPEVRGRIDHSSAGAQYAAERLFPLGHLLAYGIAGHHAGLLDGRSDGPCLVSRLGKQVPAWQHAAELLPQIAGLAPPPPLQRAFDQQDPFAASFLVRMLFSCLVDADFLDTEAVMDPEKARQRPTYPENILALMEACLDRHLGGMAAPETPVNRERARVRDACLRMADSSPGLFSLTVPTGGGKTLSSLAFALRHAAVNPELRRIIYVIPFTSIIEQNADQFRRVFQPLLEQGLEDVVLEHHSNLDVERQETTASRLASETWDAPLVVTTAVQLYESLFHNRTSRCRKLHNLARSILIFDEVQTLPVQRLRPCLRVMDELVKGYGASLVLCTATQPALHQREELQEGLADVQEIVPDREALYLALRRTTVRDLGKVTDRELCERLARSDQVLCIVNTRQHARTIFNLLGPDDPANLHLSALMCPAHRSAVLQTVRQRLAAGQPCRLISTQLIEAGVDIDFPVVYRSMAGIDSIAQAAGRCNRHGTMAGGGLGQVFLFRSEHDRAERYFAETAGCGEQILALYPDDPLSLEAVEHYFRLYYWQRQDEWDRDRILDLFHFTGTDKQLPFSFDFATAASRFRIIESTMKPVIVPWGERGAALCEQLRDSWDRPKDRLLRALQRYTVNIHEAIWQRHLGKGDFELVADRYPVLLSTEIHYSEQTGLTLDEELPALLDC